MSPACKNCYAERDMVKYGKVVWGAAASGGTRPRTAPENWRKPERWAREAVELGTRPLVFTASIADIGEEYAGPIIDAKGNALFRRAALTYRRPDPREYTAVPFIESAGHPLPQGWHAILHARGQVDGTQFVTVDDMRLDLFALMGRTAAGLDWLALTKRPDVLRAKWKELAAAWRDGVHSALTDPRDPDLTRRALLKNVLAYYDRTGVIPNVWAGATVENQDWADRRLPFLDDIPTARHFVSVEPQVGPIKLSGLTREAKVVPVGQEGGLYYNWLTKPIDQPQSPDECRGIHWVISGGESGPDSRPAHPQWYRSLRNEAVAAGVPFHFKQHGEWVAISDATPEMGDPDKVPTCQVLPDGKSTFSEQEKLDIREGRYPLPVLNLRVGKKKAGRLLDDVEWHQTPRSVL